jgi:hypothetical protein
MNSKTPRHIGHCLIGKHVKKPDYVLLRFRDITMVAPKIIIQKDEMEERGLFTILQHLHDGPPSDCVPFSFKDPTTRKEMLKLKREHLLVTVELFESDGCEMMKIIPMHSKHGFSFDTFAEEVRIFPSPKKNGEFIGLLAEALEVAN